MVSKVLNWKSGNNDKKTNFFDLSNISTIKKFSKLIFVIFNLKTLKNENANFKVVFECLKNKFYLKKLKKKFKKNPVLLQQKKAKMFFQ